MNFNQVIKYINYKLFSKHKNGHGVHSPFVFDLITNVFLDKSITPYYKQIEDRRENLLHSEEILLQNDFGALESKRKGQKTVGKLAKNSLKNKKYSQLLNRLIKYYEFQNILEFGTSFGITTSYLKIENSNSKITTIEGCENISKIAQETFDFLNLKGINLINDKFDNVLENIIDDYETFDFVFFDGNHKKEPTLKYYNTCLDKINNNTVFVFDDIYWSKEMESAWKTIKKDIRAKITIDIFSLGLVFFKKSVEKQHYIIKF